MKRLNCIVGSRAFNLNDKNSDIDIFNIVANSQDKELFSASHCVLPIELEEQKQHYINRAKEQFFNGIFLKNYFYPFSLPELFSFYYLDKQDETFLTTNNFRDKLFANKAKDIYFSYLQDAEARNQRVEIYYGEFNKRYMYALQCLNTLRKYASYKDFKQSIWQEGAEREIMLAVRRKELPLQDYQKIYEEWHKEVVSLENWYTSLPVDFNFIEKARLELNAYIGE